MKANKNLHSVAIASATLILFLILISSTASAAPYTYITNSGDNTASVINTITNKVTAMTVFITDTATNKVTSNVDDGSFILIPPKRFIPPVKTSLISPPVNINHKTSFLSLPENLNHNGVAVSPDGTKVYVASVYGKTVSVIDTNTNKVIANVSVGNGPDGLAVTQDGTKVYVANANSNDVSVIDTATNRVTANVSVGRRPNGVAVSPDGTKVYVANFFTYNVSVIDTATNTVTANVSVEGGPNGVAVTQDGTRVYVTNFFTGNVSVIDTATNTVTANVSVGSGPNGVEVTEDGTKVYVTNHFSNNVSVIDTATNKITANVSVESGPVGVAVGRDGTKVYVANTNSNNVSVIDTATNKVTANVSVGSGPDGVAVSPNGKKVYAANHLSNEVFVIETATNRVTATVNMTRKVSNPNPEIYKYLLILVVIFLIGGALWFIATQRKKDTDSTNEIPRNLQPPVKAISYPENFEKWAIIVGISKYKDESLNLKYADRDAEELYKLLLTPAGGGFKEDHIKKLINEEATTAEITNALRSYLKKASENDIVILYFACHGSPDPDRPKNIYLLTHDTISANIAGTALPMREIDLALKEDLSAERVVIIADTCHSAAIGGGIGRRGAGNIAQATNAYLQAVSKAKGGVALLTSAEANESSQESELWGGGHGVFTYFLLQGMLGDADGYKGQPKDGKVTVGELFEYVRDNVMEATNQMQHPAIGPNPYDRSLPISISSID